MLLAFLWAGAIGYAQIYVGVHYPTDIAGGAILGIIFGSATSFLFNKYFGIVPPGINAN
jgi:undecaprenyl-diphosphatase